MLELLVATVPGSQTPSVEFHTNACPFVAVTVLKLTSLKSLIELALRSVRPPPLVADIVVPDIVILLPAVKVACFASNAACNPFVLAIVKSPSPIVSCFPEIAVWTKAVVANCVVFVPAVAVGANGVPVNVGSAFGAF